MTKIKETLDKLYREYDEPITPWIQDRDFLYYDSEAYRIWEDAREFKPILKLLDSLIQVKKTQVVDIFFYKKSLIVLFKNYAYEIKDVLYFPDDKWQGISESEIIEYPFSFIHFPLSLYPFIRKIFSWKRQLELYCFEQRLHLFLVEQEKTRTKEENVLYYQIPNVVNSKLSSYYKELRFNNPDKLVYEDIEVEGITVVKQSIKELEVSQRPKH